MEGVKGRGERRERKGRGREKEGGKRKEKERGDERGRKNERWMSQQMLIPL